MSDFLSTIVTESVDIVLVPVVTSQYFIYSTMLANFGAYYGHSDCIGYMEEDVIAARKYPGSLPMFQFIYCFQKEVWTLIIVSILILSLILSFDRSCVLNLGMIPSIIFNLSISLVNCSIENLVIISCSKQLIIVWLLSAFVLYNEYSSYLMDYMIRAVPMEKIDSLEDLAQHKHMTIFVRYDDSFLHYIEMRDNPMKLSLIKQVYKYEILQNLYDELARGLRNGSSAYVSRRNFLIFNMLMLSEYEKRKETEPPLIDLLHFSEKTDFYEPYFLLCKNDGSNWLTSNLNKMYLV